MEQHIIETSLPGSHTPSSASGNISAQKKKPENSGFSTLLLAQASDKMKDNSKAESGSGLGKAITPKGKMLRSPKPENPSERESVHSFFPEKKKIVAKFDKIVKALPGIDTSQTVPAGKDEADRIKTDKKGNKGEKQLAPVNSEKQNLTPLSVFLSGEKKQETYKDTSNHNQKNPRLSFSETEIDPESNLHKKPRIEVLDRRPVTAAERRSEQFILKDVWQQGKTNSNRISNVENRRRIIRQSVSEKAEPELPREEQNIRIRETEIKLSPKHEIKNTPGDVTTVLARKLAGQEGNEIVRLVRVVLNNSDSGEVNINLRPDNLGRIRVKILMEKNRLTGKILVDSAIAREAMRASINSLQSRLTESGFSAVDLDLAWDKDGGWGNNNPKEQAEQKQNLFIDMKEVEDIVNSVIMESSGERINITV